MRDSRTTGTCSRKAANLATCSWASAASVAEPGANGIGSISTRWIRESDPTWTRPIQLTGAAIALTATFRTVLQRASLISKRGSLSRPPTGSDSRISPRRSFISATIMPRGSPMRACAPSPPPARATSS